MRAARRMIGYGAGLVTAGTVLISWADAAAWWPVWGAGAVLTAAGAVRLNQRRGPGLPTPGANIGAGLLALVAVVTWSFLLLAFAIAVLKAKKHSD